MCDFKQNYYLCVKLTSKTKQKEAIVCFRFTIIILYMANKTKQYCYEYWRPSVATDCVIFGFDGKKLKVLLIERNLEPFKGCWALPGGFLRENDKTAEQCALRELKEETNLSVSEDRLWQLGVFSEVDRDPRNRVISLAYYALVEPSDVVGGDDAAKAQWFDIDEVPQLAFDHAQILAKAREAIKRQIHFDPIGYDLLGKEFTLTQVQTLYEAIQGVVYDRRNFARKLQSSGIVTPLGKKVEGTAHKAPQLFECNKEVFKEKAQSLKFELKKF